MRYEKPLPPITVRCNSDTYTARLGRFRASSTNSAEVAALNAARKYVAGNCDGECLAVKVSLLRRLTVNHEEWIARATVKEAVS
jgi:hypothetical protein